MKRKWILVGVALLGLLVVLLVGLFNRALLKLDYGSLLSRAGWQRPARVIEALAIRPGDRIADVGAGGGYFTFPLAQATGPGGVVYAVDVDQAALRELGAQAAQRGTANVVPTLATPDDSGLAPGSVDLAFFCNAFHEIEGRVAYFGRFQSVLKPGGRVAILEMRPGLLLTLMGHGDHGTDAAELRRDMETSGYRLESELDFLPFQSFLLFRRE